MVEGKQVKEMAFRARCLKEVLLGQVGEFYERWNERLKSLSEKHKQEKKLLLSRGIFFVTMSDFWRIEHAYNKQRVQQNIRV